MYGNCRGWWWWRSCVVGDGDGYGCVLVCVSVLACIRICMWCHGKVEFHWIYMTSTSCHQNTLAKIFEFYLCFKSVLIDTITRSLNNNNNNNSNKEKRRGNCIKFRFYLFFVFISFQSQWQGDMEMGITSRSCALICLWMYHFRQKCLISNIHFDNANSRSVWQEEYFGKFVNADREVFNKYKIISNNMKDKRGKGFINFHSCGDVHIAHLL